MKNYKLSDEKRIAEELKYFFVSSVKQIVDSIQIVKYENLFQESPALTFNSDILSINTLKDMLKLLNNKKDHHHYVSVKLFVENFDILGNPLYELINKSLRSGIFPNDLKESCIVPVQKIKNTKDPLEIRPVNMLMTISKIIEKIVQYQLNKYFEDNDLLKETQSGFRHKHRYESVLNLVITQWKTKVANKKFMVAVFLDLKRAFETINREILLLKLNKYDVRGTELKWFKSYRQNRKQRTKWGNIFHQQ